MNAVHMFLSGIALYLVVLNLDNTPFASTHSGSGQAKPVSIVRLCIAVILPILMVVRGLRKGSLNRSGAAAGFLVGCAMTLGGYCYMAALLAFFLTASKATKFRSKDKVGLEENFKDGGQRNWVQVLCNGGAAAALAAVSCLRFGPQEIALGPVPQTGNSTVPAGLAAAIVAAVAAAAGDTFSSELGPVLASSEPRLITTLRKVPRGTNGGVTLVGSACSAIGGTIVGVAYSLLLALTSEQRSVLSTTHYIHIVVVAATAGLLGSTLDSVLGALLQFSGYDEKKRCVVEHPGASVTHITGIPLLDNHSVNMAACLLTAAAAPRLASFVWAVLG